VYDKYQNIVHEEREKERKEKRMKNESKISEDSVKLEEKDLLKRKNSYNGFLCNNESSLLFCNYPSIDTKPFTQSSLKCGAYHMIYRIDDKIVGLIFYFFNFYLFIFTTN
jgi:hypothetical protein